MAPQHKATKLLVIAEDWMTFTGKKICNSFQVKDAEIISILKSMEKDVNFPMSLNPDGWISSLIPEYLELQR